MQTTPYGGVGFGLGAMSSGPSQNMAMMPPPTASAQGISAGWPAGQSGMGGFGGAGFGGMSGNWGGSRTMSNTSNGFVRVTEQILLS